MDKKKGAEVRHTSHARRAAGHVTRNAIADAVRAVLRILLSALVFSSLNYVSSRYHIRGMEEYPWVRGVLVALVEETLRHYESKLIR